MELIIGDRQTGKTAIAIDTIINQKGQNVKCIYVAIGQKAIYGCNDSKDPEEFGAMVLYHGGCNPPQSELAPLQYIAPIPAVQSVRSGWRTAATCWWFYDDLTKHAAAYRTLSLC